jgi:hypothetical protein
MQESIDLGVKNFAKNIDWDIYFHLIEIMTWRYICALDRVENGWYIAGKLI